jgi:chromosomal replication initiation ATPase DnaA
MTTDTDTLEANLRNLERENRELKETLRDQFAMAALQGMVAANCTDITPDNIGEACWVCYRMADKMMEARK